ncbi:phosphotransferase [Nonomuraea diastatica]|uniref:phosphotransferase n=1 Tax=Nonomuraea diastatica TaxID=1848329 RepID=UPI001C708660|nr:phosphotransferase [Nonomuraea diastatica]
MTADVIVTQVESLLSRHRSAPVTVAGWQRLEPYAIGRARLEGGERLIVKWMRPHPGAARHATSQRLRNEVAALRFLSDDLTSGLAPRVIAADLDAELVVLEDLAPRTALDGLLRAEGATAHADRLAAFARVRGELNAATAGRSGLYGVRRRALGPAGDAERFAGFREEGRRQAALLGAPIEGGAERELAAALEELEHPGPFLALSNGDPEANNVLVHATGDPDARLIDFEFAGRTHALHDAVCLHVPGPGWVSVDAAFAGGYRRALVAGVPEAEDDRRYGFGLAAACFSYVLVRLERVARVDARPPGDGSRVQLVATLEAAARTADEHRSLPRLAGWARRVAGLLRRRWPDADLDLDDRAAFPPYTPRRR